ncbi:MAG: hypothetical protein IPJ71_18980 [Bdellovibrionales bacterium]|nr:hypothetical protein [Bdellovibrionales bacterium]
MTENDSNYSYTGATTTLEKQTIVIHPFDPGGGEDEPDSFARELVQTFGDSSKWTGMNLGFLFF